MKDKSNYSSRWNRRKLGEVAELNPKTAKDILYDDLEVDFIPMRLVEEKTGRIAVPEKRKFQSVKQGYVSFANNDILFAKVTPCMENGKIAITHNLNGKVGFGSSEFHVIRVSDQILNSFLFYFLVRDKFRNEAAANMTGAVGLRRVSKQFLENYILPVPTLQEQKAIVTKIEELFSELDAGRRQLEVVKKQLITYRQSVLKFAYEGKFTKTKFVESKTGNIVDIINNGYTPSREFLSEDFGDIPFIKVYNLNFNGTLNFKKNPTFIPKDIHKKQLKRSICLPGDVLINIVGPPLGKVSIVTDQFPEWNINQAIVMFRPNEKVISKFLSYFLQNSATINWLEETSKATAGQWNVKVSTCREIPIPICSPVEQEIVVNEIESRLSVCEKLEEIIETCLQQSEVLKQSILKQAFEGKLVK